MTGPTDPDATRPYNEGDATQPVGQARAGPPPGGPPPGPIDDDEGERRSWWPIAAGVLALGILVGVGIALLAGGGDDEAKDATTSSSTTTSSTTTTTSPPPTSPPTTPQAPGQVTDVVGEPGGGSGEVSLHWNSVPGAATYRIYRSFTQGTTGSLVATVSDPSYVDVPGQKAYYQVSAVSSGGLEGQRSVETCGAPVGEMC
jgi:hypothetical protein